MTASANSAVGRKIGSPAVSEAEEVEEAPPGRGDGVVEARRLEEEGEENQNLDSRKRFIV